MPKSIIYLHLNLRYREGLSYKFCMRRDSFLEDNSEFAYLVFKARVAFKSSGSLVPLKLFLTTFCKSGLWNPLVKPFETKD